MADGQIDEGDELIVHAQPWMEHGDVGVVVIDEEATVRTTFHRHPTCG